MKAEILILGILHRGDMHPYEIKRSLKSAHAESYIDFDVGTLYYAVRKLTASGLIEKKGRETVGNHGERTIYGITEDGRARFQDLISETLTGNRKFYHPLFPALLFLHLTDQTEAAEIVLERLEEMKRNFAASSKFVEIAGSHLSLGMRLGLENANLHQEVEIKWLEKLHGHLQNGDIKTPKTDSQNPELQNAVQDFVQILKDTGHDK